MIFQYIPIRPRTSPHRRSPPRYGTHRRRWPVPWSNCRGSQRSSYGKINIFNGKSALFMGKSPCLMRKSPVLMVNQLFLWPCSIVLLNYQRVLYRVLLSPQWINDEINVSMSTSGIFWAPGCNTALCQRPSYQSGPGRFFSAYWNHKRNHEIRRKQQSWW